MLRLSFYQFIFCISTVESRETMRILKFLATFQVGELRINEDCHFKRSGETNGAGKVIDDLCLSRERHWRIKQDRFPVITIDWNL